MVTLNDIVFNKSGFIRHLREEKSWLEKMSEEWEAIDWENPFDEYRSSEVSDITLEFLDNGVKAKLEDEDGKLYTKYKWSCIRTQIENPTEIMYSTSSKRLIDAFELLKPVKGKELRIVKTGTGFGTMYSVSEV